MSSFVLFSILRNLFYLIRHLYEFINSFSSFRSSRDSFISRTEDILIDFIHGNPSDIIVLQFLWDTSSNRHLS